MDLEEEAGKLAANPYLRYAPLLLGLVFVLGSAGLKTWKRGALEGAQGKIAALQFKIQSLGIKENEAEGEKKKARFKEDAEEARKKLTKAQEEAASEAVDAQSGVWLIAMAGWAGGSLVAIGFLVLTVLGSNYEKAGALVGLGFVVAQLL